MTALLFTVSLPYLRAHAGRILLTLLGVIIGVQGMVAMGALNHSIIKSFEAGLEAIAGSARLQIAGPETGIPDTLAEDALRVPGVQSAVAIVDGSLTSADDPSLRIRTFGIDLLSMVGTRSPQFPREHVHIADEFGFVNALDSIALGAPLLARLGVKVGDTVPLATPSGIRNYVVRGTLDDVGPTKLFGGLVALLDLPVAEAVFLSPGLAQTIYVHSDPAADIDELAGRLRTAIGDRARVERTEARGQQMDALLGSVRVALSLASLVTMIAAFFIIYETIAISVEQRRREIAITRSLGFTRRSIAGMFILESLILGLLGAAGGVAGGYVLARLSLTTAVAGVSGMYFTVAPGSVFLPIGHTTLAVTAGCAVCVFAAAVPALDAASTAPARILRGVMGATAQTPSGRLLAHSALLIVLGTAVLCSDLRIPSSEANTAWIMLGYGLMLLGFGFLASHYAWAWSLALRPLASSADLATSLAWEFFSRKPLRIAAAASAIMVGAALVVVLGSVVHSIEATLREWIDVTLGADIKIGTGTGLTSGSFEASLVDRIRSLPQVLSVERHEKSLFLMNGSPVVLVAIDPANRPHGPLLLLVRSLPEPYAKLADGSGVAVSESFARRYGHDIEDKLTLPTASHPRVFQIVAVVRDYTMDVGTILIDIDVYQRLWRDNRLTYAQVWPRPGTDLEALRGQINVSLKDSPTVAVVTNSEFRADVEKRVRDLLGVLGSLQILACAIAVLGVVTFLLAASLDRRRELSILRSVGVSARQIRRAVMIEGGLIGITGATLGILAGIPAAYLMVAYSMPATMGWSLHFVFPTMLALTTLIAVTVAAALAAYFPARQITRGAILAGLQME
ncbi:MAG: ABC transporter permease [Deltaproteobacteria bacterium]|nr:ABC transporter permease [Deltaproteobacteria bacterium]